MKKKFSVETKVFFRTVNRLKNTSDCIKIDPPGPGQNLEKSQKTSKKESKILDSKKSKKYVKILDHFKDFFVVFGFFCHQIFYKQKTGFFGWCIPGAPLRGALGRAPPPFARVEILKKFTGKSVPENCTLFFGKNIFFGHFTYQNALICI